jgi:hypothetical protein
MNYEREDKDIFDKYCKGKKYYPLILPARKENGDIFVFGDIHGDYDLAIRMLKLSKLIDNNLNWIGGNAYIVTLGDQLDGCRPLDKKCEEDTQIYSKYSGTIPEDIQVFKLFDKLNEQAIKVGGAVISLLGNHELMNAMGNMSYVSYQDLEKFKTYKDPNNPKLTFASGKEARMYAFHPGHEYANLMACNRLPCVIIGSYLFVHAGFIQKFLDKFKMTNRYDLYQIGYIIRKWLLGLIDKNNVVNIINSKPYSPFWDRILGAIPPNMNNNDPRCVEHLNGVLKIFDVNTMFVGHTPQSFAYHTFVNKTCGNSLWRTDFSGSHAFNKFDPIYKQTQTIVNYRKAQILRIRGDNSEPEILHEV